MTTIEQLGTNDRAPYQEEPLMTDDTVKIIPEPVEVKITPEEPDKTTTVEHTEESETTETITEPADSDEK